MHYFNKCLKTPNLVGGSMHALDNTLLVRQEQDHLDTWLFPFQVLIKTKQKILGKALHPRVELVY